MTLPSKLQGVVDTFQAAPRTLRLQLLLEYAEKLPPLPAHLAENRERLERVEECQAPVFVAAELQGEHATLYIEAPREAPTTRGFASILHEGLSGASGRELLSVPDDVYQQLNLAEIISPLRLRSMAAVMTRLKRQLRDQLAARDAQA